MTNLKHTLCAAVLTGFAMLNAATAAAQPSVETQRLYLSGKGCDDMVKWDFLCTDGRNAGKWTKIGVPSCRASMAMREMLRAGLETIYTGRMMPPKFQ